MTVTAITRYSDTVTHSFEAAHRLPHLTGKHRNLHGHSWLTTVTITAQGLTADSTVVEIDRFRSCLRGWIDTHLDHAALLGHRDKLVPALEAETAKLVVFGRPWSDGEQMTLNTTGTGIDAGIPDLVQHLEWPTVENLAVLIQMVSERCLTNLPGARAIGAHISGVHVTETAVNAATWGTLNR